MTDTTSDETIDQITDFTFEKRGYPISTDAAESAISQLIELVPKGGSRFGFSKSYINTSIATTITEDGSWRIDVTIKVPSRPSLLFAHLASCGIEAATRKIQFVLRADQSAGTAEGGQSEAQPIQFYTVLNGDFPNQFFCQEDPQPQDFRDKNLRDLYGAVYATTNFEDALKVIRSELTGEKAFTDAPV